MRLSVKNISRRQFLLFGAAAASATALVGNVALSDKAYIRRTLRRLVGPIGWADNEFDAFYTAFREIAPAPSIMKVAPLRGLEALGMGGGLSSLRMMGIDEYQQEFERELLTAFALGTDYLTADDPSTELIHFSGFFPTCANPFAEFPTF